MKIRGEWPRSSRRNLVRYKYVDETGRTIVLSPRGIKDATEARQEMRDFEDAVYHMVRARDVGSDAAAAKSRSLLTFPAGFLAGVAVALAAAALLTRLL